jgi:hypothetical protein
MRWNTAWSILRRVVGWTLFAVACLIGLLAAYNWLRPLNWHQVVIETGQEKMASVFISMCDIEYPVNIKPGRISSEFPDACEGGPHILLQSANAQYWCFSPYVTSGLPAEIYRYKIENGKCEMVSTEKRGKGRGL